MITRRVVSKVARPIIRLPTKPVASKGNPPSLILDFVSQSYFAGVA